MALALFLLPLEYVIEILSAAVHEILGHGLSATVLGGTFSGFVVRWDGMAQAFCDLPTAAPLMHQVLCLAAGVIAEITCGIVLWGLVSFLRQRLDLQVVLLVASFICLSDGASYLLWNAYRPVPPGDVGRIIWLCSSTLPPETSALRWVLLSLGGLLLAGTVLYFYPAVFVRIEALLAPGRQLAGGARLLTLLTFLVLPDSLGWLVFDWEQLAPGIGRLPSVVGVVSAVTVAGLLFWYRPRFKDRDSERRISWRHIALSWMCLFATVLAVTLWFSDGVRWGSGEEAHAGEGASNPRIGGFFAISESGKFLSGGVERDNARHAYMLIPLTGDYRAPVIPSFPGSDRCLGAMWRPAVDPEELLFVTAGEIQTIKRLRVSSSGLEEISSYPVDANLIVTGPSDGWSPGGQVFALRVSKLDKGIFSGAYVGFSKDYGKSIHVSAIPAAFQLLWTADDTLYVTHILDKDEVVLSQVKLNLENMTAATQEVIRGRVLLAGRSWYGCLVYAQGGELFRDGKVFAILPEKIGRPVIDGDYLAVASAKGKRVYILDGTGKTVDVKETPDGSYCIGISAANRSIYLTASAPEARTRIYAYNFVEKRERVLVEARDVFPKERPAAQEQ